MEKLKNIRQTIAFVFLLIALIDGSSFIHENVVFEKVKDVSTTRSKWLVAFMIDINPYQDLLNRLNGSVSKIREKITREYAEKSTKHSGTYDRLV